MYTLYHSNILLLVLFSRLSQGIMSENLTPVVFCGPSGVGKGTLIEMLMKRFPNGQFGFSVSHTTRKPREGEVDGTHYNFSTVEAMKKEIDEGKFVEYAEVRRVRENVDGAKLIESSKGKLNLLGSRQLLRHEHCCR